MFDRRTLLAAAGAMTATPALAQTTDPRLGERAMGRDDAPMTVIEFFSLTCSHCGSFHRDTWPQVKSQLVDTGRVRMVWRDFPLDQVALRAAAVARSFPAERYEPFLSALFSTQDRWAFARGVDHKAEIGKIAALAGMAPAAFEAAWADDDLARAILAQRQQAEREFNIQATPSFVFGRRLVSGAIAFDRFAREAQTP
ncbi:thioredoxin domain-containing protein [Roseomonas eburnea]|uniref:Thioredoxin domain-containing protein n=1 Tax=Neoroseomonas eburnea TaxID=1346889 RepID=A0A9X9X7E4_9PROT|nr:thioredoxin domain-containing protein [Neoroseomonas eburnea]MBR0679630.1 thioredoxin domain-containing protein [Neoroseomonas eburnea]